MNKLTKTFKSVLSSIASILVVIFMLVMWSAYIKSCFTAEIPKDKSKLSSDVKIVRASTNDLRHQKIVGRMGNIYALVDFIKKEDIEIYFINDPPSLNAASFGNGVFLFWETLDTLPDWATDCVLAHEIGHDSLLHSRKIRDADDVRNFFTDVLSLIGGADRKTERTLQEWSSKLTLPQYSQKQEYEADRHAVKILSACGYEKPELVYANALKYIRNRYGDAGGGFFDYHPSTEKRIEKILSLK